MVCSRDSTVLAAIELDDRTHEKDTRVKVDERKNKASTDAGLKLLRWNVRDLPDDATIRAALLTPTAGAEPARSP